MVRYRALFSPPRAPYLKVTKRWPFAIVFALIMLASCTLPRDPKDTTGSVRNNVMVVGVSENPPWVTRIGDEPGGIEADLVEQFARQPAKTGG